MAKQLFTNNSWGTLQAELSAVGMSLTLNSGQGARFASPTGGDWFLATLIEYSGDDEVDWEVVKITAKATDTFTISARAQDGTDARIWPVGTRIEVRSTASWFNDINSNSATLATPLGVPSGGIGVATITGIMKGNGTSAVTAATSGSDYSAGTAALASGMLKSTTGTGALSIATSGTDYAPGTSALATGILKSTTSTGALSIATAGTDYTTPAGTESLTNKTVGNVKHARDDDGTVSGGTWAIDYANGPIIKATAGANITSITMSNWPSSGTGGHLRLMCANFGAYTITFPTAWKWIKNDLTTTTTFADLAVTLPSSGTAIIDLFGEDGGTTIYAVIARN